MAGQVTPGKKKERRERKNNIERLARAIEAGRDQ
jgi:hypothetical protein